MEFAVLGTTFEDLRAAPLDHSDNLRQNLPHQRHCAPTKFAGLLIAIP
jgi:hypothetical protein